MKTQKIITDNIQSKPILLGIIAILLLAGVYFLTANKAVTPSAIAYPTPTQPSETANWKTHRDLVYGFEIKIPASWFIYPTGGSKDDQIKFGDTFTATNYDREDNNNFTPKLKLLESVENPIKLEIVIATNENWTLEERKEEIRSSGNNTINIILDGKPAIKSSSSNSTTIWVVNDKKYKFGIGFDQRDVSEANAKLFDQILSTFQFSN